MMQQGLTGAAAARVAPDVGRQLRIVIAEAREPVREGLRRLVESVWGWRVVAAAGDGLEAVRLVREHQADVLLADSTVQGLDVPTLQGLFSAGSGTVVVGLLDRPSDLANLRGAAVLKGVPAERMRVLIEETVREASSGGGGR